MSDTALPFDTDAARRTTARLLALGRRLRRVFHDSGVRSRDYRPFPNVAGRNGRQESIEIPLMTRALNLPQGARILEIGCGRGIGLAQLHRRLHPERLVGLDITLAFLDEARTHLDRCGVTAELVHADARRLPFPPGSFDVVIDFGTCYHIAFASQALSEVYRVLVDGGVFVHETRWAQLFSHPVRSFGRAMPHRAAPSLVTKRWAGLWCSRERRGDKAGHVIGTLT